MYISISKQTRATRDIQFWSSKDTIAADSLKYLKEKYYDTSKIKKTDNTLSDDGLTLTTSTYWNSEKDCLEFRNDQKIIDDFINPFNDYAETTAGLIVSFVDEKSNMVSIQGPNPYPNLVIPDTWKNVEDFADWWFRNGMPIKFQESSEVFLSDDATSIALFRKGRFQVELYLIHPCPTVPVHEHPDVEVIKARLDGKKYPYLSNTLHNDEAHGAGLRLEAEDKGYPLLAIQHWLTREPTTVASMWKGNTVGPKQESLIRRFNPNAYIVDGYADITRSV
jgi:hypothetical protein